MSAAFKSGKRDDFAEAIKGRNWSQGGMFGSIMSQLQQRLSAGDGKGTSMGGGSLPPVAGKVVRKSLLGD